MMLSLCAAELRGGFNMKEKYPELKENKGKFALEEWQDQDDKASTDLSDAGSRSACGFLRVPAGAAGEAGRQVGDSVGATHGANGGVEAVAVADALGLWDPSCLQGSGQK